MWLTAASASGQSTEGQALPATVVLDANQPLEMRAIIQKAAAAGRVDILLQAMRGGVNVMDCFDAIPTLERTKQAQLLISLLEDEKFLLPEMDWRGKQSVLHHMVEYNANKLLGLEPPVSHGLLSRAEMAALVAKLRTIH